MPKVFVDLGPLHLLNTIRRQVQATQQGQLEVGLFVAN